MNSQQLLWIIVSVGVFLFFLFVSLKWEKKRPTQLNLRAGESPLGQMEAAEALRLESKSANENQASFKEAGQTKRDYSKWLEPENLQTPKANIHSSDKSQRPLTVAFMYNGHDWEAFQVLGILPGTTLPLVTEVYQNLLKSSDVSSHEFFEAAYLAILHAYRDRKL